MIGTLTPSGKNFLFNKYKVQIKHNDLPFGDMKKIIKFVPKVRSDELILITLPTPKQEIVAQHISKNNNNFKIICIGGGLSIASNDELPCPKYLENMGLESLWRLKYQTRRRMFRLIHTSWLAFISVFILFHRRIVVSEK